MENKIAEMIGLKRFKNSNRYMEDKIKNFEKEKAIFLPEDLKLYFKILGENEMGYNENLFQFYNLQAFKSIDQELKYFTGIPDYSNIINTLDAYENCFVFSDYMFHMFSYVIHLNETNDVYVICGDKYKFITHSFSNFVDLYLSEPSELQI